MATTRTDKYADYRYQIIFPEELREAKWLIEQGDFKDMDHYIDVMTRFEKSIMRKKDAENKKKEIEKKKLVAAKKKKLVPGERQKAA